MRGHLNLDGGRGAETRGDGGYIPPIIWVYPPNSLNGCTTVHLSENRGYCSILSEKTVRFLQMTFFFWSSPEFVEKSVLFLKMTFFLFGFHQNLREKSVPFAFFGSSLNFQT